MNIKKFLGIKRIEKNNKIKLYFLWIPIWKIVIKNTKIKVYFINIRMFSFAKPCHIKVVQEVVEKNNQEYMQLKAFELLNARRNCFYDQKVKQ